MASKSKAQKLDLEVEKALEQALDIDFGDDLDIDMDLSAIDDGFSVDDLEEQISRAAEELVAEQKSKVIEPAPVESAAKVAAITTASVIATPAAPPVPPVVKAVGAAPRTVVGTPHKAANSPTPSTPAPEVTAKAAPAVASASASASPAFTPANDDSRSERPIVATPRRVTENSSRLFWTTTAISVLWAAGGVALSKSISPDVFSSLQATKDFFTSPAGLGVVAGMALPVAMFWGFTQLVKRAQECTMLHAACLKPLCGCSSPKPSPAIVCPHSDKPCVVKLQQ